MTTALDDYKPYDFGLDPKRFPDFRQIQREAAEFVAETFESKRFAGIAVPQGGGKTLIAKTTGALLQKRTIIATVTIALQEQYRAQIKATIIRGRQNYSCQDYAHLDCHGGATMGCRMTRGRGCGYEADKAKARNAELVVPNYKYWMAVNDQANGLERSEDEAEWAGKNPPELLILDEGHDAFDQLASYISCRILEKDLKQLGEWPDGESLVEWAKYAREKLDDAEALLKTAQQELSHLQKKHGRNVPKIAVDQVHRLEALYEKLYRLSSAREGDWIVEKEEGTRWGRLWKFDSVFPGMYAEHYLFCGIPNVLVMSASLRPMHMNMLGLKNEEFGYRAWRRIFSANRNPIYRVGMPAVTKEGRPSTLQIDKKTPKQKLLDFVKWHDDEIIGPRLDRKGLIQTVSYDRARLFLDHSQYSKYMLANTTDPDSDTAIEIAEKFRKASDPAILVSPSFSTGWDFPGVQCEYVVLPKVPFEPAVSRITQARMERFALYGDFRAGQVMEQACFRGMRYEEDQCEVFLTDGHFVWFIPKVKNLRLVQDWFPGAVIGMVKVPKPPKRLPR